MKKKIRKKSTVRTLLEITNEMNIITKVNQNDAKSIGYPIANIKLILEKDEKRKYKPCTIEKSQIIIFTCYIYYLLPS